ncbi:ribonuclease 3 precursor, putative [Entamoeba invadens IP1]|uniref:Ribonuclease 3, putative n=1 Tax=Entamoeba invadens IP1 TaxID=370355 RepID=L7FM55_ENTIV|nr:ribonuclease 3 precursor, putative [Entamoeba invadens IP1]ELP90954.1 ribonuclease 3 precursor, putative [Entamoeba invadens IP1]|eukprot:XP_004257725.1 ribonuclease 3 precursor, putative [Entamoeba invadens IP1]
MKRIYNLNLIIQKTLKYEKTKMVFWYFWFLSFAFEQPDKPKEPEKQSEASGTTFPSLEPLQQDLPSSSEQVVRRRVPRTQQQQAQPTPLTFQLHPSTIKKLRPFSQCKKYIKFEKKFEFLMLVQYWPGGRCYDYKCSLPQTLPQLKESFWLHGLWPQFILNRNMFCCWSPFNVFQVESQLIKNEPLFQEIKEFWPSVDSCKLSLYQYDKHGACSLTTYEGKDGPFDYFRMAIELWKKNDVWKILKDSRLKVETNKLYKLDNLKEIISNAYGGKVAFMCRDLTSIYEIRVCYDHKINKYDPTPIDCPVKVFKEEKRSCADMVLFKEFPFYLLNIETAPKNNCVY